MSRLTLKNYESKISSILTLLGGAISHISFLEWILMSILLESTPMIKREMKSILSTICLHEHCTLPLTFGLQCAIIDSMGTNGIACTNTNRKFIGIGIDTDYYNIAKESMKKNKIT